jgi:Fur family ferric uptake transcriptional regulator
MARRLEAYVSAKGLKKSGSRNKILEVMVRDPHHFRVQDLIDRLRKDYPEVGRATVYRNLPLFVECGLIQEGPTGPDDDTLYELSDSDHHDHIVCVDCNRIIEFRDSSIEKRQDQLTTQLGFQVIGHRHVIYGTCDYLRRSNKGR